MFSFTAENTPSCLCILSDIIFFNCSSCGSLIRKLFSHLAEDVFSDESFSTFQNSHHRYALLLSVPFFHRHSLCNWFTRNLIMGQKFQKKIRHLVLFHHLVKKLEISLFRIYCLEFSYCILISYMESIIMTFKHSSQIHTCFHTCCTVLKTRCLGHALCSPLCRSCLSQCWKHLKTDHGKEFPHHLHLKSYLEPSLKMKFPYFSCCQAQDFAFKTRIHWTCLDFLLPFWVLHSFCFKTEFFFSWQNIRTSCQCIFTFIGVAVRDELTPVQIDLEGTIITVAYI